MSPRKNNVITIEAWPNPKRGKLYKGIVRKVDIDNKAKYVYLTIKNLAPTPLGQIHEKTFPLPARPGNKASRFLTACGIDTDTVGAKIGDDDITGVTIGMMFGTVAQDGSQEVDFEKIDDPEDPSRAQTSTPSGEQLSDSTLQSDAEHEREF